MTPRSPADCSATTIASVTIITSQGSPASSASFIAPTAPKCICSVAPVSRSKRACSAFTMPCTAPAQRMVTTSLIVRRSLIDLRA